MRQTLKISVGAFLGAKERGEEEMEDGGGSKNLTYSPPLLNHTIDPHINYN